MTDPTDGPAGARHLSLPSLVHGLQVYDETAKRYGTVAEAMPSTDLVYLRPLGGGVEWTSSRSAIRPALTSELLALRVAAERKARRPL